MVFFEGYNDGMKWVIIFFLLPTDLLMDKKLPMKNSPTENFRR
jgi:hypothetical protein